jgi:hypothetical protein
MLLLPTADLRDRVLASNAGLTIGRAKLQLLPWARLVGAEATKLAFKVRLFVDGVPFHARQEPAFRCLLPLDSLFEGFDHRSRNDGEASCCEVAAWVSNPDDITKEGLHAPAGGAP